MALDPVCGRNIDVKQSQWLLSYHGNTYHFCSGGCEHRFNEYPGEYLNEGTPAPEQTLRAAISVRVAQQSEELAAA